ncbi:SRPBCC family protein [Pseudoroseicyclus sp. CXY001]|uniref:aromatic ring-hydroxylating oxygenase subunit alpha n=1 Tax=Pseudoroseicyclus sp. CXY001 TaxID=3242492 RepID=UPI00358DC496
MTAPTRKMQIPNDWDRRGLPAWTYHSEKLFELERDHVFRTHWMIAGHVCDIPAEGDWIAFDMLGERAIVMRGQDGEIRAFHNLCRHRGARVVDGTGGHCRGALVCPFHGWVYNTDGSLRGVSRPESFGEFDKEKFGLKPVEMEIWKGFIFLRFLPGPQPSVAELFAPFEGDFDAYGSETLLPEGNVLWESTLPVNWKSVRDVDNEGYHVALAHPGLQDLYGRTYRDDAYTNGVSHSHAFFGDKPARLWSVKNYVALSPERPDLPEHLQKAWTYYGLFPTGVIAFTPEYANYYQDIPLSAGETLLKGRTYRMPAEDRQARAARYLAQRIDRETSEEDQQLSIWSNESMKSSAFEDFHLSDLEYGLKNHHDELRKILPVTRLAEAPPEDRIHQSNEELALALGRAG